VHWSDLLVKKKLLSASHKEANAGGLPIIPLTALFKLITHPETK